MWPSPFLVKINTHINFTLENVSHKFGLFGNFLKKLPKENNRPIDENSPNQVTLISFNAAPLYSNPMCTKNLGYLSKNCPKKTIAQ
jgi:hypothetical protein